MTFADIKIHTRFKMIEIDKIYFKLDENTAMDENGGQIVVNSREEVQAQ